MTAAGTTPTAESERIDALDVLRGFAVLGILLMNIQSYAMPIAAYLNPTAYGSLAGAERWAWLGSHVLADRKFMSIFSMLFGAGILLFTERAAARGDNPARLHYRRMLWLLIFGALHAYLLWYGDILFSYAACGMLAYLFRRRSPRALLVTGLLVMGVASGLYMLAGWSMKYWPPEQLTDLREVNWQPSAERLSREITTYHGDWLEQMRERAPKAFFLQTQYLLMYELWRAGGLMLIGMALYKWGVLTGKRSENFYWRCAVFGLLVGVPLILYGVYLNRAAGWNVRYSFFYGPQLNYWFSLPVSLAYIGLLMLASRATQLAWLTRPLAAVGRMAFTNYIAQSVLCTWLFYGHGLGWFGQLSRVEQLLLTAAIWVAQWIYSPLWFRWFRFGPLEWLWRSLTYWRRQPMRRSSA